MQDTNKTCENGWCGWVSSPRAKGLLSTLVIFLSLFLVAKALHEFKLLSLEGKNIYPSNVITVSGQGEAIAIPNIASFDYTVTELDATVEAAQKKATDKSNKAIDFLKSNGIEDKDMKTTNYSIAPQYEYVQAPCVNFVCPQGKQVLKGYEVSQTTSVKVRKTEDAGKVLSGIGSLAITNVSGLQFTIDDKDAIEAEARANAIKNAEDKINTIAKELHVKVVRVVSFYEEGNQVPMPYYNKEAGMAMDSRVALQAAPQIQTGENKVTSNVTVVYEIK